MHSGEEEIPAAEYAEQAEAIVTNVPEVDKEEEMEWLPVGVFALAQQGDADVAPNMFLQLAVSKEGILAGTYQNKLTEETRSVEGMVDPGSQRAAWKVAGKATDSAEENSSKAAACETEIELSEIGRNCRNAASSKTIHGNSEKLPVQVSRDRDGTFQPILIEKHQRRIPGFDEKILAMYAKGMTTRDKQDHAANRDPWFTGNTAS